MTFAFTFDASACSGCKACQAACKDKNNLSTGVLWRRVYEISGGSWIQTGDSWSNNVFAYNFTMACNHCVHPKCAGVCPVNAYNVREDGIVILDSSRCIGCGYCNWACPYAAPQYDQEMGVMSKCNFCFDQLDNGEKPACVTACPMRVLNIAEVSDPAVLTDGIPLWEVDGSQHPYPMPTYSRTQPHIAIKTHPATENSLEKNIANHEEVRPGKQKSEFPLVVFSLLAQLAVGAFWIAPWVFSSLWDLVTNNYLLRLIPALFIGASLGIGMMISFAHLGTRMNVWRIFANMKKSWLSKEIILLGLFGAGWLFSLFFHSTLVYLLVSLVGLGFIYAMANVYQLRSMPAWNNWRTIASFLISCFLLGGFYLIPVLLFESSLTRIAINTVVLNCIAGFSLCLLASELFLIFTRIRVIDNILLKVRIGLVIFEAAVILNLTLTGYANHIWIVICLFGIGLLEQGISRYQFYDELNYRKI